MNPSIHLRLLLAASVTLAGFLGLTGAALDRAFQSSLQQALQERLQGYVYALLGAADEDGQGRLKLPEALADPRFNRPGSKLVARVLGQGNDFEWTSPSLVGRALSWPETSVQAGESAFDEVRSVDGTGFEVIQYPIIWESNGESKGYLVSVAEDLEGTSSELSAFRTTLWRWLAVAALFLLVAQGLVLRWGLRPLRQVASELQSVEKGEAGRLQGQYPAELEGLTGSINSFIEQADRRQQRYRNSLDDLAHSLKTPLAVLQGAAHSVGGEADAQTARDLEEQIARMNEIVQRQLQRAAADGRTTLLKPVDVAVQVRRIVASLQKVYADKHLAVSSELDETVRFHGDQTDFMEVLGNLLDNGFKYARARLVVAVDTEGGGVHVRIDDDGPGIPAPLRERVIERGLRADELTPGQGIGLSVADEIIRVYGGTLYLGESDILGGAKVDVRFPAA